MFQTSGQQVSDAIRVPRPIMKSGQTSDRGRYFGSIHTVHESSSERKMCIEVALKLCGQPQAA